MTWTRRGVFAVGGLLLVFVVQMVAVARVYSLNWDEAHHLYDGYKIWAEHDYRLNAEVPPLVKLVAALPLLPMRLNVPPNLADTQGAHAFLEGRRFVVSNGLDRVLLPARMACMVLTLLLAGLLYVCAREMFGGGAAQAALALFVFDPLVLAHGTLVSTDIGSALLIFGTVYAFYRYCKAPGWGQLAAAGEMDAALAMAEQAVALAPDSAATQRWAEALEHYRRAGELARTVRPELEDESYVPRSVAGVAEAEKHLR